MDVNFVIIMTCIHFCCRVYLGYHTISQTVYGVLVGITSASVWFSIVQVRVPYTIFNVILLVSPHFMRGRELSTLVVILSVILSVIMGIHFKVIKLEHRVLYSH